jgi:glutamine synthetase
MLDNLKAPEDVLRAIKDGKVQAIDLRFTDLPGQWHHFLGPPSAFDLESLWDAVGFDGSSIPWLKEMQETDVRVIPDPASAFLDPFTEMPTLVLICNIRNPVTGQTYNRDARSIAHKAEAYLQTTPIGDTANFGLELEYFVVNRERNDPSTNYDNYEADTAEANWSAARRFRVPPANMLQSIHTQMVATLEKIGLEVEAPHREFASSGQGEIEMRFATLTRMADNVMIFKYVVNEVARQRGMTATFMPKPPFSNNDSGMHVHQSAWYGERPLFAGDGYAGSSALMRHYMAGLLAHAPALLAICASTANRSTMPRFETPVNLGQAQRNRSAACRIPMYSPNPKAKRVEFRCPYASCNPYLAFAAMLLAGIDGFHNRLYTLDPDEPIENFYNLPLEKPAKIPCAPSLKESLNAVEADHAFLLQGDVFTPDVIRTHLSYKRAQ